MANKWSRKIVKGSIIIAAMLLIGYGGYRLYHYAIEVAIEKIKKGVSTGLRKSVTGAINPLKWPGKILGFKKDKNDPAKD